MRARTTPCLRTIQILEGLDESDPSSVVVQINLKVVQFNNYVDTILNLIEQTEAENQALDLYDVILLGERIDEQAQVWPGKNESAFVYQTAAFSLSGWPGAFDIYETLGVANDWNMVRCARVSLSMSIITCCQVLLKTIYVAVEAQRSLERAQSTIATLLEDIVASFPYCLGRGDAKWDLPVSGIGTSGFALLWPTGVLLRCPFAKPEQKRAALQMIDYIGRSLGLQRAVFLKEAWERGQF